MQARNAASVLPEPVGAEISVVRPARMCGQPSSCGSVGVPNLLMNQSATSGCAQERGETIGTFYSGQSSFANCSPMVGICMREGPDFQSCRSRDPFPSALASEGQEPI